MTKVDPAGIVRLGVTGDDVRAAAWPELPDDLYAEAQVPEVIGRDKLAAAAEPIPAGRATMAAIREDEPSMSHHRFVGALSVTALHQCGLHHVCGLGARLL
ncbi:MAG TPA: hypothetical protein VEW66_02775 [Thermomicrobiales bacterium]|nr:hypothetical protein [Thermomicrobiales bacterium]